MLSNDGGVANLASLVDDQHSIVKTKAPQYFATLQEAQSKHFPHVRDGSAERDVALSLTLMLQHGHLAHEYGDNSAVTHDRHSLMHGRHPGDDDRSLVMRVWSVDTAKHERRLRPS